MNAGAAFRFASLAPELLETDVVKKIKERVNQPRFLTQLYKFVHQNLLQQDDSVHYEDVIRALTPLPEVFFCPVEHYNNRVPMKLKLIGSHHRVWGWFCGAIPYFSKRICINSAYFETEYQGAEAVVAAICIGITTIIHELHHFIFHKLKVMSSVNFWATNPPSESRETAEILLVGGRVYALILAGDRWRIRGVGVKRLDGRFYFPTHRWSTRILTDADFPSCLTSDDCEDWLIESTIVQNQDEAMGFYRARCEECDGEGEEEADAGRAVEELVMLERPLGDKLETQ